MDLNKLGRRLGSGSLTSINGTESANLTSLPANLLEAVIPGYSIISRYILETVGLDISLFVTIGALLFACTKAATYLWTTLELGFRTYCMSSIHIEDSDDLYDTVLKWIADQRLSKTARSVKAKSPRGSAWDQDADETRSEESALDADGTFNFAQWQAQVPPRYEPYYGRHRFWHRGKFFIFHRSQRQKQVIQGPWGGGSKDDDLLELSCVGRMTEPIKDLLKEIKVWALKKQFARTSIRNPTAKDRARHAGSWSTTSSRPSRPMATVILDQEQKRMIQQDMNEFLHPSSPRWYAQRGIPYRRGYLFHGPPGTGKTSLSFALAGIFGLEIYCIALNDPEMTESDLQHLFNGLPRRCIVLLEDIDEAGIKRDEKSGGARIGGGNKGSKDKGDKEKATKEGGTQSYGDKTAIATEGAKRGSTASTQDDTNWTLQDLARALKSVAAEAPQPAEGAPVRQGGRRSGRDSMRDAMKSTVINTGVSLSGLLNAIDGVATHEGRILIMTTNHPDKLDAALIRSGRVDMQIKFTYAKKPQIQELFLRMYAADLDRAGVVGELDLGTYVSGFHTEMNGHADHDNVNEHKLEGRTDDVMKELNRISGLFADKLPDETFAPSDIQGFLLLHKKTPRKALEEIEEWRDEQLAIRAKKEEEADEDD